MSSSIIIFLSFLLQFQFFYGLRNIETWNKLFSIDASTHFTSNEQLQTAHEKYFNRIKLNNYRHINERHPFILQLPNNCGVKCHTRLNKIVGQDQHRIISSNYAQLYLEEQTLSNLKNLYSDMILDYVPMLPSFKIEKLTNNFITNCQSPEQFITLLVTFGPLTNSNIDYLSSLFKNFPLSVKYKLNELQLNQETHLTIELDCENAKKITSIISSLPYTLWIERRMEFKTYSRWARGLCQSGDDAKKPLYQINITGQGYIIGVSDTGIDMNHCHFFDPNHNTPYNTVNHEHRKVIYYNRYVDGTDDAEGHGTHVASTTAGKSYIDYGDYSAYNGNAYNSKLAFFDIGDSSSKLAPPSDINSNLLQVLYNVGARVFSNSWGSSSQGRYTTDSRAVDAFMWNNPDALGCPPHFFAPDSDIVLFAAGNDGDDGAMTVGSPSTSKNCICVGASMSTTDSFKAILGPDIDGALYSDKYMAGFSSQGPTVDGRLKPDIAAPGWFINAAKAVGGAAEGHCEVQQMKGTSMATPTMAGNAVLIKQYFQDGWYPSGKPNHAHSFIPSGALLKAMLIQSGVGMDYVTYDNTNGIYQQSTGGYPSTIQGYGKIRLDDVLNFGDSSTDPISLFVRGSANTSSPYYVSIDSTHQMDTYTFRTSTSTIQPRIRITLAYTDQFAAVGSAITLVNALTLNVTEGVTMKAYHPYLAEDIGLNNVLMVDIQSPRSNTEYKVQIHALVLNSPQSYALVITGEITEAKWNTTSSSTSDSLSNSISKSMRKTIAILCLVIVIFGGLLAVITYQLRRALRMSDETFDADDEDHDAISHQSRNTRHSNGRNGRNMGDIEHRELTEREIQMISSRR